MNTAQGPILDATLANGAPPQSIWPLPATEFPQFQLTWTEWVAKQTATSRSDRDGSIGLSAQMLPVQQPSVQTSVMYFDRDEAVGLVWPLPGTQLPKAHLTWAEWVEVQASGTTARHSERAASKRAA